MTVDLAKHIATLDSMISFLNTPKARPAEKELLIVKARELQNMLRRMKWFEGEIEPILERMERGK